MNNKEYFDVSKKEGLPKRCPLIGKCERFAVTILCLSDLHIYGRGNSISEKLSDYISLHPSYKDEKINMIGENFYFSPNSSQDINLTLSFSNACPEVPLFLNNLVSGVIPNKAISSGHWDKLHKIDLFGKDGKFKAHNYKHYSECEEFSLYQYEKKMHNVEVLKNLEKIKKTGEKTLHNTDKIILNFDDYFDYYFDYLISLNTINISKEDLILALRNISEEYMENVSNEIIKMTTLLYESLEEELDNKLKELYTKLKETKNWETKIKLGIPLINVLGMDVSIEKKINMNSWSNRMYDKHKLQIFKLFGFVD